METDPFNSTPPDKSKPASKSAPHEIPADEMDFLEDAIPIDEVTEEIPTRAGATAPGAPGTPGAPPPLPRGTSIPPVQPAVELVPHQPGRREPVYLRQPTGTGNGAVRCKTFIAKLRPEALERLDDQINAWLDANPGFEVKFATSAIGELIGKTREQALFVTVYV